MSRISLILTNLSLTVALWLNFSITHAQDIELKPSHFLAQKPIQAKLHLNAPVAPDDIYLLPGGPYEKSVENFPAPILASYRSDKYQFTSLAKQGVKVTNFDDSSIEITISDEDVSTYTAIDNNDKFLLTVSDTGTAQLHSLSFAENTTSGSYDTHADIIQAQLGQQYAYLLASNGTLFILDISNPEWPLLAGEYYGAPESSRFALQHGIIWLAAGPQGLIALDVADPLEPVILGRYKGNQAVTNVTLQGDIALITSGLGGLTLLDISEPTNISWIGSHSKVGNAQQVVANEQFQAAIINDQNFVYILDISMPNQPSILSSFRPQHTIQQAQLIDDELHLVSRQQISHWDISAEQPLLNNENLNMGEGVNFGGQRKGYIENDILYVADWFSGLHIYDISQGKSPRLLSSFRTPGSAKGVIVKDGIAYVADDDHGLQLVDVSNPTDPQPVSDILTKGLAYTPIIDNDLLYLASHHGGFQIIDISDVFQPKILSEYDTPSKAWSIALKDKIAYVADAESGLLIFDTNDPKNPKLIGTFDPNGNAEDILIDGDLAYVAFFDQGLYVLDISDPTQPRSLSHLPTRGNARGLDKQNYVLYIADWLGGIHAVNIANPRQPKLMGSYDTQGAVWGLKVQKSFAYAFDWWGGLNVLDIRHPSDIRKAGDYNQRATIHQVQGEGDYLFAAQGTRGLQVYDINNPLNPTWVTGEEIQGHLVDINLIDHLIYGAAEEGGLAIFDVANPFSPKLITQQTSLKPLNKLIIHEQMIYARDSLNNIIGFDITKARQPQQSFRLDIEAENYAVNKHFLTIINDNQLISYRLNKGIPEGRDELSFERGLDQVLLVNQHAYLVDKANTLHIADLLGGKPVIVSSIPLPHQVVNFSIDDTILHILDKHQGVYSYTIQDFELKLSNRFPLLSSINQLYPYRNQLYGTGENYIVAINKQASTTISATEQTSVFQLSIPEGLPTGSYDIVITGKEGSRRIPNAMKTSYFGVPSLPATEETEVKEEAPTIEEPAESTEPLLPANGTEEEQSAHQE